MSGRTTDPEALADAVCRGERRALARAITLVESTRDDDRANAERLLERLATKGANALRLGITGVPGVGKSTFINALALLAIGQGRRVAVLTVDPSSRISGGSILGDKTRMADLARHPAAFVRPSPAGDTLGGVHRRTRDAIVLLEAAGFDLVIVETVGVGQSETAVAEMTDLFALLILPGGGDELQGIKRGIVELADFILVNKADGDTAALAGRTVADYRNALRYLRGREAGHAAPVLACSALTGEGIASAWEEIRAHHARLLDSGALGARRAEQARSHLWSELGETLLRRFRRHPRVRAQLADVERRVSAGELPPTLAVRRLLALFTDPTGREEPFE